MWQRNTRKWSSDNFGNVTKEHEKIVVRQFSNAERLQKIFYWIFLRISAMVKRPWRNRKNCLKGNFWSARVAGVNSKISWRQSSCAHMSHLEDFLTDILSSLPFPAGPQTSPRTLWKTMISTKPLFSYHIRSHRDFFWYFAYFAQAYLKVTGKVMIGYEILHQHRERTWP